MYFDLKKQNYSSDAPIYNPALDQFNRFPFAQRIASVISHRNDPSSIVIGIYGAWGEGKTSVFNFIESELQNEEDVICIKFNPWRFGDEDQMLINFFNELAIAINRSIESGRERVGDIIVNYGKPLASLFGKGEAADGLASFFSRADIEELRGRIETLLEEEKKRVVILVDDIDRLEKNEIYAVFRLVKLTADFKYTAYILAFDKHVVSAALQERYGVGDTFRGGNSFLEKIIQVPLHLPSVDKEDLKSFYLNEIDQLINLNDIELTEEDIRQFVTNFSKGLETHLKTPRQAKLYSNILMFSLPILKNEVNIVDLMLIEGVKVFLPTVYSLIREHEDIFLKDGKSGFGYEHDQKEMTRRKERIEKALAEFSFEEKENIKELLCFLFPQLNKAFKNVEYGREWEAKWSEKQRICSHQYFQRYFTYAINNKDVSDIAINELLEYGKLHSCDEILNKIKFIMTEKNVETFISKLRRLSKNFTPIQSKMLAISIAKLGDKFPNPVQMLRPWNTFGQAAMFTVDCIENLQEKQEQVELAKEVILTAEPLSFAAECFSWFRRDTEEYPNPQGFSDEEYKKLAGILAERISIELRNLDEIQLEKLDKIPYLMHIWSEYGKPEEASNKISEKIQTNHDFLFVFLNSYTPTAFGEFGAKKSSFSSENYDAVTKVVDPLVIVRAIEDIFGDIKLDDKYPEQLNISRNEELARQFLLRHHNVLKAEEGILEVKEDI